jgi:arsenate reductase
MSELTYLHNQRCRKSREGLALLEAHVAVITVREYLKDPLNEDELLELAEKLDQQSLDQWIRKGEEEYKTNFKTRKLSIAQWAAVLEEYPKLLERPILIAGERAVVGRPAERLLSIIKH